MKLDEVSAFVLSFFLFLEGRNFEELYEKLFYKRRRNYDLEVMKILVLGSKWEKKPSDLRDFLGQFLLMIYSQTNCQSNWPLTQVVVYMYFIRKDFKFDKNKYSNG